MATTEVQIKVNGTNSGSVVVVDESSMAICDACGDDIYVHEWIALNVMGDEIYACDRITASTATADLVAP